MTAVRTDTDDLFPPDPTTRAIARELYGLVAELPIVSPHGHVPVALLAEDRPLEDPAALLVADDHYVTRLLHASGVPLERLRPETTAPREIWRALCRGWTLFDGTASGYWLRRELHEVLGVREILTEATADSTFEALSRRLAEPGFRPRALFERFGIEVLATTDDPLDRLEGHAVLAADPAFRGRVLPTFRAESLTDPTRPDWSAQVDRLLGEVGAPATFASYLDALRARRDYFRSAGATAADHAVAAVDTEPMDPSVAARMFDRCLRGTASADERRALAAHLLFESGRMSVDDGLVMCLHAGVLRDHHRPTHERFGPDTGHDIPMAIDFTRSLRPLLEAFGTAEGFHLVVFTVDEAAWSRELAPLAGFYPSVFLGSPWWFLDAPDALGRFRSAVTETVGFSRGSGFVDDTRGFCSIPVRHDTARRVEAGFLARLVVEGRISRARADRIIVDLIDGSPRRVFRL